MLDYKLVLSSLLYIVYVEFKLQYVRLQTLLPCPSINVPVVFKLQYVRLQTWHEHLLKFLCKHLNYNMLDYKP